MVMMLEKSKKPRGGEAGDLIGSNLNMRKRAIYKLEMQGRTDYAVATKKWLVDLLELLLQKSEGEGLSDIWTHDR